MKNTTNNTNASKTETPFAIQIASSLIAIILACSINLNVFGQNHKQVPPTQILYSTSASTDDVQSYSTTPHETQVSQQEQNLINQLDAARSSNNAQLKEQLEAQLNQLKGSPSVQLTENTNTRGGSVSADHKIVNNNDPDYVNSTIVPSVGIWSSATQTVAPGLPNAGRIWVATTVYAAGVSDTCKLFYSDNGGQTWNYAYYFYFFDNSDFRAGELDMELAYDGSTMWINGVAGYYDATNGRTYSMLFRFNTTTNIYSSYNLLWPGYATSTNKYYNPRITSDNSNYTSLTYLYLSCSFDSTFSGSSHYNALKFAMVTSPFVLSPVINYSMPNNGKFYWYTSGVPASSYLWSDIAYFRTSGSLNRIITVYNVPGSSNYNLYLAWSDNYGSTASNSIITETNVDYGARIAFNGGSALTGMITYVRNFSGNDWDPYFRNTTDGGATWISGMIDPDINRCRSLDVIAVRGASNQFKAGYTQDATGGTKGYYAGFIGGVTFSQPYPTAVTTSGVDTVYTKVIAGYKNGGGDDCFAIYSMGTGSGLYSSRLCQTTLGITSNGNNTPSEYKLSQNYPNPFNPSTIIKFAIPQSSFVKMTVYDINGREVTKLVDQQMNAGSYDINFDASRLASGAYFYRIDAGKYSETKKMLLIK